MESDKAEQQKEKNNKISSGTSTVLSSIITFIIRVPEGKDTEWGRKFS